MNEVNPYDKAHELARAIKGSDAYRNYVNAKGLIDNNPEAKEQILALRQRQMEINRAQIMGEDLSNEKVQEMALEFAKLNRSVEIAEFFKCEGVFIQVYNDLMEIIHKAVEMDLL